jgi:hypothetical protein
VFTELSYGEPMLSRSGLAVPVFRDGRAMYSLYDPRRDAEIFASQAELNEPGCALVVGIGDGSHIAALHRRYPKTRLIAAEYSRADIDFLYSHFDLSELAKNPAVVLCTINDLLQAIPDSFIPVLHGSFLVLYQRAWRNFHAQDCEKIEEAIFFALEKVKNDYAAQGMFGKIWHRNILQNLQTALTLPPCREPVFLPVEGETCIAAAGPSLDRATGMLAGERCRVIAADTAYPALLRRGVAPLVAYTIDGQIHSVRHFMRSIDPRTVLAADLCCNPVIPRLFAAKGNRVIFTGNRHPLCRLFARYLQRSGAPDSLLPEIDAGSGAVAIAAYDFARKAGCRPVAVFGADFAYINGKPYASGTYFEEMFHGASTRIDTAETRYTALMYRGKTRTEKREGRRIITTPLLDSYRESFQELQKKVFAGQNPFHSGVLAPYSEGFFDWYLKALKENLERAKEGKAPDAEILASCLPLGAWKAGKNPAKPNVFSILKLAYNLTERYTKRQYESKNG